MRARAAALAVLALVAAGASAGPALAAGGVAGPLRAVGPTLRDPQGRIVVLHGLFAVWKQPPYVPAGADDPADPAHPSFTDADADAIRRLGLDGVRLAWFWQGLEPSPGRYSTAYLDALAAVQARLARRGVFTVLDSHQDQYGLRFGDKPGFPDWATLSDGLPVAPAPSDPAFAAWRFPLGYFHPATGRAFGHLYAGATAGGRDLRRAFGAAWQVVARRFAGAPMVVGYDLVNEPFPGTTGDAVGYDQTCVAAAGCPGYDRATLQPFETVLARAIRRVDPRRPVFYEPTIFFNGGIPNGFAAPPADVRPAGLSFHDQCPTRAQYRGDARPRAHRARPRGLPADRRAHAGPRAGHGRPAGRPAAHDRGRGDRRQRRAGAQLHPRGRRRARPRLHLRAELEQPGQGAPPAARREPPRGRGAVQGAGPSAGRPAGRRRHPAGLRLRRAHRPLHAALRTAAPRGRPHARQRPGRGAVPARVPRPRPRRPRRVPPRRRRAGRGRQAEARTVTVSVAPPPRDPTPRPAFPACPAPGLG